MHRRRGQGGPREGGRRRELFGRAHLGRVYLGEWKGVVIRGGCRGKIWERKERESTPLVLFSLESSVLGLQQSPTKQNQQPVHPRTLRA